MSDESLQNATRNKPTNEHWHGPGPSVQLGL